MPSLAPMRSGARAFWRSYFYRPASSVPPALVFAKPGVSQKSRPDGNGKASAFAFDPAEHPRDEQGRFIETVGGALPRSGAPYVVGPEDEAEVAPGGKWGETSIVYNPGTGQLGFARGDAHHEELLDATGTASRDRFAHVTVRQAGKLIVIVPPFTEDPLEEKRWVAATFRMLDRKNIAPRRQKVLVSWMTRVNALRFGDLPDWKKLYVRQKGFSAAKRALDAAVASYRPDYARIERTLDALQEQLLPRLQRVFRDAKDKVKALIERRVQGGGLDFRFVEGLELRGLGDLVPLLRAYLHSTFLAGRREAGSELARAKGRRYVWDEAKHPRESAGSSEGGRFAPGGGGGVALKGDSWEQSPEELSRISDELSSLADFEGRLKDFLAVVSLQPGESGVAVTRDFSTTHGDLARSKLHLGTDQVVRLRYLVGPGKESSLNIYMPETPADKEQEFFGDVVEVLTSAGVLRPKDEFQRLRVHWWTGKITDSGAYSHHASGSFFRAYTILAAKLHTYREQAVTLPSGGTVALVDGDPGHGPCANCGYSDETRSGVCFGCFMTQDFAAMAEWERKLFSRWLAENPGWPQAREWKAKGRRGYVWDESRHPRESVGSKTGGQFAPAGGGGQELQGKLQGLAVLEHSYPDGKIQFIVKHPQLPSGKSSKEVGEIAVLPRPDGNYEVSNILVWPEYQRQGYAGAFYRHAFQIAQSRGKKLFISSDLTEDAKKLHGAFRAAGVLRANGEIVFRTRILARAYAANPFLTITDPYGGRARVPLAPTPPAPARPGPRPPWEPLPPEAAIGYFEDKAFAWRGILADELLTDIKRVLLGTIATGEPPEETYAALERIFSPYVGDLAALPDQEQTQPYRLETLVRTNTTEAYNNGRKEAFADSVADGFIVGFEFDATIDSRTTSVCRFLDGKILPPEGEKLDRLTPPRCFNCRSILSPITRIEDPGPEIISDADFATAIELSCEGFSEAAKARAYAGEWDESKHPRQPEGLEGGGQFAPVSGPGWGAGGRRLRVRSIFIEDADSGKEIGRISASFDEESGGLEIHNMGVEGGPNTLGVSGMRELLRALQEKYGGRIKQIKGLRMTGIRRGPAGKGERWVEISRLINALLARMYANLDLISALFDSHGRRIAELREGLAGSLDLFDVWGRRLGWGRRHEDGTVELFRPDGQRLGLVTAGGMMRLYVWDESQHPRMPVGTSEGGQFAPASGDAGADLYGAQSADEFPETSEEVALKKTLSETVGIGPRLVIQDKLAGIRLEKVRKSWETAARRADSQPDRSPDQKRWEAGLTDQERQAVVSFLSQPYDSSRIREVQRADADGDRTSAAGRQAQLIRAAIDRAPKIRVQVFRGIGLSYVPKVGDEVKQDTFKSWSRDRSIAFGYAIVNSARRNKIIYRVETDVVDVAALGPYSQIQKEVWVDKGRLRVFRVTQDPRYEDTWHVELRRDRFAMADWALVRPYALPDATAYVKGVLARHPAWTRGDLRAWAHGYRAEEEEGHWVTIRGSPVLIGGPASGAPGRVREWTDHEGRKVKDEKTLERIRKIGIPPAWSDVQVSADPKSALQAIGKDAKGRAQYKYSVEHVTEHQAAKFRRVSKLAERYPKLLAGVEKDMAAGKQEEALVAGLILRTFMRIGSDSDTKADVKAYGATTLEARHVSVRGDVASFDFIGKKGVPWKDSVEDPIFARAMRKQLSGKSGDDPVFSVDGGEVNKYFKTYGKFSAKDVRTLHGTAAAKEALAKEPSPVNKTQARSLVKRVAEAVAARLHNTIAVAKSAYINPVVWAHLEQQFGFKVLKAKA